MGAWKRELAPGTHLGVSRASVEGAVRGVGPAALAAAMLVAVLAFGWITLGTPLLLTALHLGFFLLFGAVSSCRLLLPVLSQRPVSFLPAVRDLPAYSVIVPLRDEAAMAAQIVGGMQAIDYPRDRLEVLLVLEADDYATAEALTAVGLPSFMRLVIAPPGGPATKPRACNIALKQARGDFVVIYDAEDEPDPRQLREAAARFATAPAHRGCLQAPLRVHEREDPLKRQFALEYAALFEVVLPALAALRLPFPLGGTSNHFRRAALEDVGGWDAFNVTEDADIGLRLAARGWTLDMLQAPTWEEAPEQLDAWLPQRSRWLKGYVQTWSSVMRRPLAGGWRPLVAAQLTLGLSILACLVHAPLMTLAAASVLIAILDLNAPSLFLADALLMGFSWFSAVVVLATGAGRTGFGMRFGDALRAVPYWSMQSLAGVYALHQLVFDPFRWDKTPHAPQAAEPAALDEAAPARIARAA